MAIFNHNNVGNLESKIFLDESGGVGIARFDEVKYRQLLNLTEQQESFFWRPEEIDVSKDAQDFEKLTSVEKHIFTANLKRQIVLDTYQGRAPSIGFLPYCSLPEMEAWIVIWTYTESLHSRSYTHIIRNVYNNPSAVFDEILDIPEIIECANDISKYYDDLITYGAAYTYFGEGTHKIESTNGMMEFLETSSYELKKKVWLAFNSVNVLEGIRFYVSFACSFAFAENKKSMVGNAKIIKLICRDENLHLKATQVLLKLMQSDDPDMKKIKRECVGQVRDMFQSAVDQEKKWAEYLFKDGEMIGLNTEILCEYIDWIADKRMKAAGCRSIFKCKKASPLPWMNNWTSSSNVQNANQETENSAYIVGGLDMDYNVSEIKELEI